LDVVLGRIVGWVVLIILGIMGVYGRGWGRGEIICLRKISAF
jgi:hypothetical protein